MKLGTNSSLLLGPVYPLLQPMALATTLHPNPLPSPQPPTTALLLLLEAPQAVAILVVLTGLQGPQAPLKHVDLTPEWTN